MNAKKGLVYLLSGLIIISIILIIVVSISKKTKVESSDPQLFAEYISYYTSGVISKNSVVSVRFTDYVASKIEKDKIKADDIIKISPKVKGNYYWVDNHTIEFRPENQLPPKTRFDVEVHINKLIEVAKEYEIFKFSFFTIRQNMQVFIDEVITLDNNNYNLQKIIGTISLADDEVIDDVRNLILAKYNNNSLNLKFESSGSRNYSFIADSIIRTNSRQNIVFEWNGKAIGVDKKGSETVVIPALNDFDILWTRVSNSPEQHLIVQFSDPIDGKQNFSGLVELGIGYNLRIVPKNNIIRVYPSSLLVGEHELRLFQGIKNSKGDRLKKDYSFNVLFENLKPQVKLLSKGVILPSSNDGLVLPFEAVNLKQVDVRIIRIFENNITQFLQVNQIDGARELNRVGKIIVQKEINLDVDNELDLSKWNRFSLDLNELILVEPGAIYRISIGFRKHQSLFYCEIDEDTEQSRIAGIESSFDYFRASNDGGYSHYYYDDYYYYDYWESRDNPCRDAYYGSHNSVSQNIISSNLGLIAKKGNDGSLMVVVSDLISAKPISGVDVEILDFAKQTLGKAQTNSDGIIIFNNIDNPFLVVATLGKQKGYLKILGGLSLSLSAFDVSGTSVQAGLKGYIYGERGVWRPGDTIFLAFILDDDGAKLPANHPIVLELRNPNYQLIRRITRQVNNENVYRFDIVTDADDLTGNWEVKVIVGGATFYKTLKIETIRPNRLKINLDFPKSDFFEGENISGKMTVAWLHGSPARNLNAQIDVMISPVKTQFEKFNDYVFDDPSRKFYPELLEIFNGKLNDNGEAVIKPTFNISSKSPGMLRASFITKAFEASGNFSIDQFTYNYYPYKSFVGIKLPAPEQNQYYLVTDTSHTVDIVIVDANGNTINRTSELEVMLFKLDWRWWWEQGDEYLGQYSAHSHIKPLKQEIIKTSNGRAKFNFRVNYPDWGRYLIKVVDLKDGHSTATIAYIDWPGYRSREKTRHSVAATMLTFIADKERYSTGEDINVQFPSSMGGRAFVSIENGKKVVKSFWVETADNFTNFSFKAEPDMAPNIFINISLLQPHAQTINDLPIRMYGILPVFIENPETHLYPIIEMPDKLRAESTAKITIKERNNKAMTYTLAIVDEGLLDLTRFRTPDPWNYFYSKEALGVTTWDLFDYVIGAFGARIERILSIGGDEELVGDKNRKANRFKPMVIYLGPFNLQAGKSQTHTINVPNYIGSVRTMVVASKDGAYGSSEKSTVVNKPLAVITEMPRLISPSETIKLPVTVFAFEQHIKNANVQVKTNSLVSVKGSNSKSVQFGKLNEQVVEFELVCGSAVGVAEIEVIATSGSEKSTYKIELEVRHANPQISKVIENLIEAGKEEVLNYETFGLEGTNGGTIELSTVPALNLEKRLKYLISYPHGCVEQITSGAFPQLYLEQLVVLSINMKGDISANINAAIERLIKFQTPSGGLAYWSGSSNIDEWGTSYAGYFLIEAKNKGYVVSDSFLKKWQKYQQTKSRNWTNDGPSSQLQQAFRLFTLALYGKAETGAMNRLKEITTLSSIARWYLAASYAVAGKVKIAESMVATLETYVPAYNELYFTYGSDLRDESIILYTLNKIGKNKEAFNVLKSVANKLASQNWYSTQATAYALVAVSDFLGSFGIDSRINASFKFNNESQQTVEYDKPIFFEKLNIKNERKGEVKIKNMGNSVLFARLIIDGVPTPGTEDSFENKLRLSVAYTTPDGKLLDISRINQGTDLFVTVTVVNPSSNNYYQMALNQILPSGFEIVNTRLMELDEIIADVPNYQDIRDDRVYTYFHLPANSKRSYKILVNAAFKGRYYLPAVGCEAMYDASISASEKGRWIVIE